MNGDDTIIPEAPAADETLPPVRPDEAEPQPGTDAVAAFGVLEVGGPALFEEVPAQPEPETVAAIDTDDADDDGVLSAEVRQQLARQFEQWLDRMAAGEALPEGLPEEIAAEAYAAVAGHAPVPNRDCDLYTLFASLTGLTGEIKLQGRAFKQLTDALAPVGEVPGRIERLEAVQAASVEQLTELANPPAEPVSPLPPTKDVLAIVFDLYDRMERGLRTFDAGMEAVNASVRGGVLWRLSGGARHLDGALAAAKALREGYQMTLSRLEAAMHQWGIERLGATGDMFDPEWMTAVDVQVSPDVPAGTVLEVYRSGYELHGQVLATAQVKVAKTQG